MDRGNGEKKDLRKIASREIGPEHPPLIIAEIGINHNGDLDIAKKLIDAATTKLSESEPLLTKYDTVVGDGDCGLDCADIHGPTCCGIEPTQENLVA